MLDNENNRENHPILNQVYDIITKFHNQGKQLTLICKVPANIGIKGNKEADKAAEQAIDMPGMITTRLPYTDNCLSMKRAMNSKWRRE